jgi:hypothetical protein
MIEGFEPDSDTLTLHLLKTPKNSLKLTGYCQYL